MKIKFFATYRSLTGLKEADIPAPRDVWALLELLATHYGTPMRNQLFAEDGHEIGQNVILLVNGRHITHLAERDTPLTDADTVSLFPMVAGG